MDWTTFFMNMAATAVGGGIAWWWADEKFRNLETMTRKAVGDASDAKDANRLMAEDIDNMYQSLDDAHNKLEQHENTFAKSRGKRRAKKEQMAPKTTNDNGVSSFVSSEAS